MYLAVAAVAALSFGSFAPCQPVQSAPEQSIKAAYLYNFAGYVEWPEQTRNKRHAPLTIGIIGDDVLADELEKITSGRLAHGRRMHVRRVHDGDLLDGLHILFIAADAMQQFADVVAEARAKSILVVTESGNALALGSVINFRLVDQRVRFEVSLDAADKSGLSISSRLLAVAERVEPRTGG
jgi:hypothetical protein